MISTNQWVSFKSEKGNQLWRWNCPPQRLRDGPCGYGDHFSRNTNIDVVEMREAGTEGDKLFRKHVQGLIQIAEFKIG